jgi:resuscitation-promoting factor RpfA
MSSSPGDDSEHDAKMASLYRLTMRDGPSPAVDAAVLAAAHRAVSSRPRKSGAVFEYAWRGPLSLAAVVVLAVSLVILMREEAPEIAEPPHVNLPMGDLGRQSTSAADRMAVPKADLSPDKQQSGNLGLKPPSDASPGLGMRAKIEEPIAAGELRAMDRAVPVPSLPPARALAKAFPGETAARDGKIVSSASPTREPSNALSRSDVAAVAPSAAQDGLAKKTEVAGNVPAMPSSAPRMAESGATAESKVQSQPPVVVTDSAAQSTATRLMQSAPAARYAPQIAGSVGPRPDLVPEKWLALIEDLRKQGRLEEAKSSLAEFKKRYPEYSLPASIKEWARP